MSFYVHSSGEKANGATHNNILKDTIENGGKTETEGKRKRTVSFSKHLPNMTQSTISSLQSEEETSQMTQSGEVSAERNSKDESTENSKKSPQKKVALWKKVFSLGFYTGGNSETKKSDSVNSQKLEEVSL
jgi:hypothetical protein